MFTITSTGLLVGGWYITRRTFLARSLAEFIIVEGLPEGKTGSKIGKHDTLGQSRQIPSRLLMKYVPTTASSNFINTISYPAGMAYSHLELDSQRLQSDRRCRSCKQSVTLNRECTSIRRTRVRKLAIRTICTGSLTHTILVLSRRANSTCCLSFPWLISS